MGEKYERVLFEIFGKVQGVFFRVHTEREAKRLGLVGYVLNTSAGSVKVEAEGPPAAIESLLQWAREVGSPQSQVDRVSLLQRQTVESLTFTEFRIIRSKH